jgi:integrase
VEQLPGREDIGLRERTLWRMLDETAARPAEVPALDVEDLDLPGRRARVRRKGGAAGVIVWQTGTVRLLPRLLKGRKSGPVFVTVRKARVELPAADLDPAGRARLSYQQAAALFSKASGGATRGTLMWLRSPTRRSAPSSRSMRSGGGSMQRTLTSRCTSSRSPAPMRRRAAPGQRR